MTTIQEPPTIYINVDRNLIIDKHIEEQVEIMEKYFENYFNKNTSNDIINQMLWNYIDFNKIHKGQEDKLKEFTWDTIKKNINSKSVRHMENGDCNENENEKEKEIAEFDTDNLDTALYQDNCDWSFDKPINKPYHTIYIFDKEEE